MVTLFHGTDRRTDGIKGRIAALLNIQYYPMGGGHNTIVKL